MLIEEKETMLSSAVAAYKHTYYLADEIRYPDDYIDLFDVLAKSGPDDVIEININSPGGMVDTAIAICEAMRNSQATIVTHVDGVAASAASLILLCGEYIYCGPHAEIMIHSGTTGYFGEPEKIRKEAKFYEGRLAGIMKDYYSKFFTDEEIDEVIEGKDLYLTGEDMNERLRNACKEGEEVGDE